MALFFLLENVTNLHYHILHMYKYLLSSLSSLSGKRPEERMSVAVFCKFSLFYFCEMGWCVLLLPCIYIHYCDCQASETETAYLDLRHTSSQIFIIPEYSDVFSMLHRYQEDSAHMGHYRICLFLRKTIIKATPRKIKYLPATSFLSSRLLSYGLQ